LGNKMHRKFHKVTWSDFETLEKKVEELELQRKLELRDELTKELASKTDIQVLKTEIQAVRTEMQAMEQRLEAKIELVRKELSGEIDKVKTELDGKIDKVRAELREEILKLDRKFTIMFLILFFTFILFNKDALEFLLKVLGLIK